MASVIKGIYIDVNKSVEEIMKLCINKEEK